jgi:hypothetical protein
LPLRKEQTEIARRFFRSNGVVADCPYCATSGWEARELVSAETVGERGNPRAGSTGALMVPFVCDNCGHVALFDAGRLGLIGA